MKQLAAIKHNADCVDVDAKMGQNRVVLKSHFGHLLHIIPGGGDRVLKTDHRWTRLQTQ